MNLIEKLKWRNATKDFNPLKKIPKEELRILLEAIRLAPSSYGLQLYKVLVIEDAVTKQKLKSVSWNQNQITDSSAIIVFCNYKNVNKHHIDDYIKLKADTEKIPIENIEGYGNFMKQKVAEMNDDEITNWTTRQTYIALGFLLTACAELRIDACPMEGFENEKYNKILGLDDKNLNAAVIATVGYRKNSNSNNIVPKVRKPYEELFEFIKVKPEQLKLQQLEL